MKVDARERVRLPFFNEKTFGAGSLLGFDCEKEVLKWQHYQVFIKSGQQIKPIK